MDRWVTTSNRVTSPSWGPPPPCKQAFRKEKRAEPSYFREDFWDCYQGQGKTVGHLQDDVILILQLLLPEYFSVLLSCANYGFCCFKPRWGYYV